MATGTAGTIAQARAPYQHDATFFTVMAVVIAATVIGGFGSFAMRGMIDAGRAPIWVHLHGAVFMAWTLLFVAQNALIARGSLALHRRMGWVAVGLACAMVPLGLLTAVMAVRLGRVPSFFTGPIFLSLSALELLAFTALLVAAIRLRRQTEWHRRLMLFAMIAIIGPAFGRLLPMPLLGDKGGLAVLGSQLLFVAAIIIHDMATQRRVHPAALWGTGVIIVEGMAVPVLAATPPFIALAAALAP
jgi:hypothetical protein